MKFLGSKKIETKRLILRPTEESDLKTLWTILCKKEINKYYLTSKFSFDWEKEKIWQYKKLEHANDLDVFQWSIIKKEDNKCIGQISVQEGNTDDKSRRDIGWFIDSDEQNKGYGFEAASNILEYMFNEIEIEAIETSAAISNIASYQLMRKLGFVFKEGYNQFHKYTFVDELVECYSFYITKEIYKQIKNR